MALSKTGRFLSKAETLGGYTGRRVKQVQCGKLAF